MPLVLTRAALLDRSAAWNRSMTADRATGFGVWIVILPSMPGSTVYLTARISPRMILAACGAGTLTRLRVTPSVTSSAARPMAPGGGSPARHQRSGPPTGPAPREGPKFEAGMNKKPTQTLLRAGRNKPVIIRGLTL